MVVALPFATFDDSLAAATWLVSFEPAAIETMDGLLLELAREDAAYIEVKDLVESVPGTAGALHLVEFIGDTVRVSVQTA